MLVSELERMLRAGDSRAVGRAAHTIKGNMRTLEARPVSDLAQELELGCKDGAIPDDATGTLLRLKAMLGQVYEEIDAYLARAGKPNSASVFDE